ncbi:ACP S-malonyltransferase [Sulfurimonas sp.]|uniref:ACP S-malonyltransferase n=1 Tax=Sulfurimonas sp. TaxID=2022749 RepID=UPI0025E904B9|nr:ACP S-malonyltransferase [Sulfurimonas sp.]MDD5156544.1 ACP S-malonyltransferase [Sulfurimonas sp.]
MKKITAIFAGQGSQAIGMGKDFYDNSAIAKEMFEKAGKRVGINFEELIFNENELINQTQYTQPAILLTQMVAYRLFRDLCPDIKVEFFLGHSLGEFSALCASGAIDYVDAIELVHRRGQLMQDACSDIEAGMMVLLGLDDEIVEKICLDAQADDKKVWPANYNQDGQLVVAGMKADLISLEQTFKDAGAKRAMLLNMSVASHCNLLAAAKIPLNSLMESMIEDSFEAPIISNVTTKPYSTKDEAVELLTEQLVKPVKYKQSIQAISDKIDIAIEFGNGTTLKGLNKKIAKDLETLNVFDTSSMSEVIKIINS